MSVIRRFNRPQGLKDIDVLIEDDAPISIYFNVVEVPEVITQGRSSFLIGGSNLLKPDVEIKLEITNDDSGAVIYSEPVPNYLEGTSRRVSVEVYDDTDLFGDATLSIVGELDPTKTSVPTEFLDSYNVRYTRKIYISSAGVNTQPILFYNQPRMVVNEIVKPYITTTVPTGSVTSTGGATGTPIEEEIGATLNVELDEEPAKFLKVKKNSVRAKLFGGGGNNSFIRKGRRRARRASPEVDKFTITKTSGEDFDARFIGGEITIPTPQVDTTKFTLEPHHEIPTEYKTEVENVKNNTTLIPTKPFTIIDTRFDEDDPNRNVVVPLATEDLTYTASYEPVPTQSISTVNFRSYADIRLSRLRTFSGDIDRVKVYARNKDAFGDFEVISDQQIESPELLFDVFGAGNQRIGYFLDQDHVNEYWVSSSNSVVSQDSTYLLNSVEISGSNLGLNEHITFEQTGSLPISYLKDTDYNISFNAVGFKGTKNTIVSGQTEQVGRLGIFISGSGFRVNHNHGDELGFQLTSNDQPAFLNVTAGVNEDFGFVAESFSPTVNGNGVLKFVVFGGRFYISDVSINPATSTGFSPNFVQIIAPVPPLTQERPDDYEFITEFYDVNNNIAETVVFASASTFVGGNSYIAGTDNLLSGSMFIGSAIGGGIEMAGVNSGFIRSIGYEGFSSASNPTLGGSPGFLMFSGSVLPDSGDNYKGVGLELVGGQNTFFKFHSNPGILDIRTDTFFIGQETLQFISGSNSNIEISSSLFHLDPKNDLLVIGADAVINADLTVNNLRTPAQIGGAPSTEQNASASISSQGFAAFRSASIGGFDVDETTISSTDDSLILKSSGQITGSSTLLGNKSAGQFLQFKDSTLTVQGNITADNIRTPSTIGGAPSTDLNASSSIDSQGFATFKSASIGGFTISTTEISSSGLVLKSSGQLTGSAVSMSGTITADAGRIAGWRIEGSKLSGSNATLDADGAALFKSDQGPGSDTAAAFDQLRNEYYIDFTPADQGNTKNFFVKFGPNFSVDSSGVLFASGAQFEGTISASKGIIGGFTTDEDSFSSTNLFISGSPLAGGVDDPRYMFISTSNFNVKEDGSITGSQVLFDGGKVGGWTITENQLEANNIKINAAVGYIEAGDLNNVSDLADTSTGFFVNKDGDLLVKAGASANKNYMQFKDGTLDINTDKAHISGSEIRLETPKFFLGGTSQFVSGSNGNIEISSSNFHLESTGDVTMAGTITATAGDIGGFGISSNSISSSNDNLILSSSGQITGSTVLFTGGKIAAWNISGNTLSSIGDGGIRLNGNGDNAEISVNSHTFGNSGIQLGYNSGAPRFYVGDGSQNFLKFTTSNGVDIKTLKFELDTAGLEISSAVPSMSLGTGQEIMMRGVSNSPYIALQPSVSLVDKAFGEIGVFFGVAGGSTPLFSAVGTGGHFKFNGSSIDINTDTAVISGSSIQLVTPTFLLGSVSQNNFISGSNGNMKINSDNFELDASNLELSSTQASMSLGEGKIVLQGGGTSTITVGASNSIKLSDDGTDRFLVIGSKTSFTHFNQSTAGFIVGTDSGTTKFELVGDSNNYISFDGSAFDIALQEGLELDATNIEISSLNASMSIGETSSGGKAIKLVGAGTSGQILVGSETNKQVEIFGNHAKGYIATGKSSVSDTTEGFWFANNNANPEFHIGDATDFIKLQNGDLDIASQKLEISASTIQISTAESSMSFGHSSTHPQGKIIIEGAGTPTFKMGPDTSFISMTTGSGIFMDGDGNFRFGDDDGHIKFQSGVFSITGSDVNINVDTIDIETNAFQLSSTHASMSLGTNRQWKASGGDANPFLSIGQSGNGVYGNSGVFLGYNNAGSAPRVSFVGTNGHFKFTGSDLDIKTGTLELDATNIEISSTNASMSLGEGNLLLDGGNSKIEVGSANKVTIQGGSTDNFIVLGSKTSFTHFDQSTTGIIMGMDSTVPKFEIAKNASNYFSFDGTNFDIKLSQGLELDATNIELSSTHASMSLGEGKIKLIGGSTSTIAIGSANALTLSDDGTDRFLVVGSKTSFSHFNQSTAGIILGTDSGTTKFEIVGNATNYLSFDGTNFDVKLSQGLELDASNIEISSTHASMSIGNTDPVILQSIGSDRMIRFGDKTGFGQTTTAGFVMGIDNGVPKFDFTVGTSNDNFFRIDSSGPSIQSQDVTINTNRFKLTTNAGNERIRFFSGSDSDVGRVNGAGEFVRLGEVSDDASDLYGLKIYDGTGTGSADTLVKLGQDGNEIAGWTITSDRLSGGQMIIRSDGTIESAGFASDVAGSGFRLTAQQGGFLEVENAKIRGTMATTVFEKESVNAVGGQLYVANSTTLTGSSFPTTLAGSGRVDGVYPANETTMSVVNVTGFVQGEILSIKKVSSTGFSTEYVFINSASRQNPSSETDFSGQLYVTRAYGSGISGDSGSLGDTPSTATTYSGSQVVVSTGRYISGNAPNTVGSGYIRLNANPADPATPYMDIVERTGSGIYDVELKARLGDLSGLSSGLLFGETNPGFGLFTENVFLKGAITAVTGSITGKLFVDTSSSQKMIFGIGVDGGSNDGLFINANNYWYTNGEFKVGSATYNIRHDSSGNISISPKTFELDATNIEISSTNASMSLGEGNVLLDGTNSLIQVGKHSANHVEIKGTNTQGYIRTGKSSVTDSTSGFWLANNNSDPEFSVGSTTNFLRYDGGTLSVQTQQFELAANTDDLQISSAHKSMSLASGHVLLDGGGNVGYVRIGSNSTYDRNINISGSATQAIIKAGKTSFTDTTNAGFVLEKTNTDSRFFVGDGNSVNFIKFDTSDGVQIQTKKFELAANTDDLQISATQKSMSLAGGNVLLDGAQSTGYIRVGSAAVRRNNIQISGSNTLAVIKAGFTGSYADGTTAGDNGFILERNLTSTKFHVGSATEYIRFDGTNVDIAAQNLSITASDVNIAAGNSISIDTPDFEVSSTQKSMSLGYDTNGDVGINIVGGDPSTIFFGSKTSPPLKLVANDQSGVNEYFLATNNKAFDDTTAGVIIGSDAGVQKLQLYKDANEFLTYNSSTGFDLRTTKLDITTGAGLTISGVDGSTATNNKILLGSATTVDAGEGIFMDGGGNFRVGDATSGGTNFLKFTSSGTLTIKSEDIDITSTAFELNAGSGDLQLSSTHKSMSLASQKIILEGDSTDGSLKIGGVSSVVDKTGENKGFFAEGDGNFIAKAGANKYIQFNDGDLDVKTDKLQIDATDFEVSSTEKSMSLGEGKIKLIGASTSTITVGSANPITISDDGVDRFITVGKSNFSQFDQSTEGIIFGTDNGNAKFEVAADGNNYFSFDGSTNSLDIAAQTFNLNASTLKVSSNSSGSIALGASPPTTYASGTGFFVDGAGNLLLGSTSGNFIQFAAGSGNLTIKSQVFSLFTSTIVVDSSVNNGKIALGASPPTSHTSGNGFYADGTGKFLVGNTAGNFVQFNGTQIIIKAPDFFLGDVTNHISGSGGTMKIKSVNFELDAGDLEISSANVSMSLGEGKIKMIGGSTSTFTMADKFIISSDGTDEFLAIGDKTSFTHFNQSTAGVIMGRHGSTTKFEIVGDGSNYLSFNGSAFDLKSETFDLNAGSGKLVIGSSTPSIALTHADATFSVGTITSDSDTDGAGVFMDGGGHFRVIGNSTNQLIVDGGSLTMKSDTFDLATSNILLRSAQNSGMLSLGSTPNLDVSGSNSGIYMDGTGDFLAYGNSTNFFKKDGTSLTINAGTFNLATTTMILDSGTSSGIIKLGTSATNITETANTGLYMDGTGKFRVGTATSGTDYFHFDGSNIDIKTQALNLDATKLYIDSTNQRIAIGDDGSGVTYDSAGIFIGEDGSGVYKFSVKSSSGDSLKFDGAGNLTITGTVTADAGAIGGFSISGDDLSSGTGNILLEGGAGGKITVGGGVSAAANRIVHIDSSGTKDNSIRFAIGHATPASAPFQVSAIGVVTASAGLIADWILKDGCISSSLGTVIMDANNDGGRGAIHGGNSSTFQPKSAEPASTQKGFFLGASGFFAGDADGGFMRFVTSGTDLGLRISGSNFNLTPAGDVSATNMDLDGTITFTDGSGGRVGTIGPITLQGSNAVGIDLGKGTATAVAGGAVVRSATLYEQIIIEGGTNRFVGGNGSGGHPQAIQMGLDYLNGIQGIMMYEWNGHGYQFLTYHDNNGTINAHTITNDEEWVRIQPALSGSVSILEPTQGGTAISSGTQAQLAIGSAYNSTVASLGYNVFIDLPTFVDDNFRIDNGSLALDVANSATDGRIDAANDIVAFATSDIRFKENVTPIQDAVSKVKTLRGVEFDWKQLTKKQKKKLHGNEGHDVGVIAQEVEKVLPEVVQTRKSGYKAVKYEKMIPLLIQSIKEQQEQIEDLKKEVEELKNGSTK